MFLLVALIYFYPCVPQRDKKKAEQMGTFVGYSKTEGEWKGRQEQRLLAGRSVRESPWGQTDGMPGGFPHPGMAPMVPAACRVMPPYFASQEEPGDLQPS